MTRWARVPFVGLAFGAALWACAGTVSEPGDSPGSGNGGGFDGNGNPDRSSPVPASPSPLQRLNALEYRNSVRDLFPGVALPEVTLPPDELVAGFAGQTSVLLTDDALADYVDAAEAIATAVSARGDVLFSGCDVGSVGQDACVEQLIRNLVPRAYRRPLSSSQEQELLSLYRALKTDGASDTEALEGLISRVLLAPAFLYKIERGSPAPDLGPSVHRLDDYELAARLSFFLWRSLPDQELFLSASRGELSDLPTFFTQAERLLADRRAADVIWDFHEQWLELTRLSDISKSETLFPEFDDALRASMGRETRSFVDHVVHEDAGTFETLLAARYSFLDDSLAQLYGIGAHQGPDVATAFDAQSSRAGILGHASFLATHAKEEDTSVVHRGLFVRRRLICEEFGPPPPGVETLDIADRVAHPQCGACHKRMDPIGYGLEEYDAIGRHQTGGGSNGIGTLAGLSTGDTVFSGPAELGDLLVRAPETWDCYVRQWYRYAMGRPDDQADETVISQIAKEVGQTDQIKALILAVIASTPFQTRELADSPSCEATR